VKHSLISLNKSVYQNCVEAPLDLFWGTFVYFVVGIVLGYE